MPNEEQDLTAEQAAETAGGKAKKPKKEKPPKEKKPKKEKAPKKKKPKKEKPPKEKKPPKAKKPKAAKPPQAKKDKKGAKAGKGQQPKERGGFPFIIIPLALIVVLLIGLGASIFFDFFQVRTGLINFLSSLDSQNHSYAETLQQRDEALTTREAEMAAQQEDLQRQQDKLKSDETKLNKRTADLDERERKLTELEIAATPIYRGELSDEKLAELKNLGKIYSSMSPESAANILPQLYSAVDMAAVLFYMDKTAAAAVMELLSPEISAQITTEMLRE